MLISEMSGEDCRNMLSRLGFGRLACAHQNRPYIVPIYFAYEPDHLYGFTTLGQKVDGCVRIRTSVSRLTRF